MSSDSHDVPKMVAVYKKLFLLLVAITAIGIVVAYWHIPVWLAVTLALVIMVCKSSIVYRSFKHLLNGRAVITILFGLTAVFAVALLLGPYLSHEGELLGTEDISKQHQLENPPAGAKKPHGS